MEDGKGDSEVKLELSQEELTELINEKFGAKVEIKEGKIMVFAMMKTIAFSLKAPKTPLDLSRQIKLEVSMSITLRMFLRRINQELEKRNLDRIISITPDFVTINIQNVKDNVFIEWLKNKTLKKMNFEDGKIYIEI